MNAAPVENGSLTGLDEGQQKTAELIHLRPASNLRLRDKGTVYQCPRAGNEATSYMTDEGRVEAEKNRSQLPKTMVSGTGAILWLRAHGCMRPQAWIPLDPKMHTNASSIR